MSDIKFIILVDSAIIVLKTYALIKVGYRMNKLMIKFRYRLSLGRNQRKITELIRRADINVNGIIIIKFCVKFSDSHSSFVFSLLLTSYDDYISGTCKSATKVGNQVVKLITHILDITTCSLRKLRGKLK